jgi:hypothetical protein
VLGFATGVVEICAKAGVMASRNEMPEIRRLFDSIEAPVKFRDFDHAVPEPRHFKRKLSLVKLLG